jgi:RND superfamily putative drug exporter
MQRQNLAARAGRWSAAHWKTAAALWILVVLLAVVIGRGLGTHKLSDSEQSTGETARAESILANAGFKTPASESVLVQSAAKSVDDPAFKSTVQAVLARLKTMPQVQQGTLRTGGAGQISKDRRSQLIEFDMTGKLDDADKRVEPLLDAVATLQKQHPAFTVAEFGFASATHDLNDTIGKDFQKAETLSLPITFLILLIAFGAIVAAGHPVQLALSAVHCTIGL